MSSSPKVPKNFKGVPEVLVENVIQKYKQGSTKDLDSLLNIISDPKIEKHVMVSYLKQFKACITLLNKDFELVVGVLLKVTWLEQNEVVRDEYKSFVINLVSAHPIYLRACLRMVVKHFTPDIGSNGLVDDDIRKTHENNFYILHNLLFRISQIVPMTPVVLIPLLDERFPFITKSTYIHEMYVKNLLQISTYLMNERSKILAIIVERMAKLDARAPRASIEKEEEDDEDDSDTEEGTADMQFDMDDIGNGENVKSVLTNSLPEDYDLPSEPMKHPEADRLDAMVDVLFNYTYRICYPDGNLDWSACKKLYLEYLSVFDKIVLPSHALCHTQFFLFYICSFKEELTMGFIDFLWKKVSNPATQVIFRQTAISYIASLLARAKYVSLKLVQSTLDVVVEWVHKYVTEAAFTTSKADVSHHGTFYAVCQAIFYIIIFRHKQLLRNSKGYKYIQQLNLQTIVASRLNPLKFCLPIIVKTFSSVMRQHQLVFCDTIMERNRRSILSVEGTSAIHTVNPLDSFFPFDPYLLVRSRRYVKHMYQEYEGTPASVDNVMTRPEEEIPMEAEMFSTSPMSPKIPMSPKNNPDFLMFGTSPGFMST